MFLEAFSHSYKVNFFGNVLCYKYMNVLPIIASTIVL